MTCLNIQISKMTLSLTLSQKLYQLDIPFSLFDKDIRLNSLPLIKFILFHHIQAMTFNQSELAVTEEIQKIDSSNSRNPSIESVGDVRVGFAASASGANSLATSRTGTRMTMRPETSMSGVTNAAQGLVKKTFHGALNGASIPMITELGIELIHDKWAYASSIIRNKIRHE